MSEKGKSDGSVGSDGEATQPVGTSQAPTLDGSLDSGRATTRAKLEAGVRFGPYLLRRLIGRGGMGEVWAAEQVDSGRRVALKVLSQGLSGPGERARFLREGRLAAAVSHPNSVYVFGSEEIEGAPAITMELLPGGTLKDLVERQGPLPPKQAVDAILQVVAGLEAAGAVGVLHRDVKPSNCFLDIDGTAKVGDFGLSVSTLARPESHLTMAGTLMGTPAFMSPEQVRCDDLDVRSDIYSVGATLYFLLTGRPPVEHAALPKMLAEVLEKTPPPPGQLRKGIPKGLGRLLMRCLKKDPSRRFDSYPELRAALEPFSSVAPTPATLGMRIAAALVDGFLSPSSVAGFVSGTLGLSLFEAHGIFRVLPAVDFAVGVAYFGLLEGIWGASVGKRLFNLRVVRLNQGVPGVWRAVVRAACFVGILQAPDFVTPQRPGHEPKTIDFLLGFVPLGVLFFPARARNGFAGLHELASGTRVVRRVALEMPTRVPAGLPEIAGKGEAGLEQGRKLGSFSVVRSLWEQGGERLALAVDPALRRPVWVHKRPADSGAVSAERRSLARPARLRWLDGRVEEGGCWDVYEAPEGTALEEFSAKTRDWLVVREWMLEVGQEALLGLSDHTLASFSPERVWIGADGHARILDFDAPLSQQKHQPGAGPGVERASTTVPALLLQVSRLAHRPLPLRVHSLFRKLRRGDYASPEDLLAALRQDSLGAPYRFRGSWQ